MHKMTQLNALLAVLTQPTTLPTSTLVSSIYPVLVADKTQSEPLRQHLPLDGADGLSDKVVSVPKLVMTLRDTVIETEQHDSIPLTLVTTIAATANAGGDVEPEPQADNIPLTLATVISVTANEIVDVIPAPQSDTIDLNLIVVINATAV